MDLEDKYWQSYPESTIPPIYGSGVSATLIDESRHSVVIIFQDFPLGKLFAYLNIF